MNGRELNIQIREHFNEIKTAFMSGYTANVISHHGILEEGITFYRNLSQDRNCWKKSAQLLMLEICPKPALKYMPHLNIF